MSDFSARDFIKSFEENLYVVIEPDTITIAYKDESVYTNKLTLNFVCRGEEVEIPFDSKTNIGECDVNVKSNGEKNDYSFTFNDSNGYEWEVFTDALEALERAKEYV